MGSGLNFNDIVDQNYTYVVQLGLMVGRLNEKEFLKLVVDQTIQLFTQVYSIIITMQGASALQGSICGFFRTYAWTCSYNNRM